MAADAILAVILTILMIAAAIAILARDLYLWVSLWVSGRGQLRNAILFKDTAAVRKLLDASPHLTNDSEALFIAIFQNRGESLAVLLERGADVGRPLQWGGAALHIAARYGTLESVQAVLTSGADINQDCGGTPLYWAADQGRPDLVELLLQRGADTRCVVVEKIGMSTFKPKSTGPEGFMAIRQRLAEAQREAN